MFSHCVVALYMSGVSRQVLNENKLLGIRHSTCSWILASSSRTRNLAQAILAVLLKPQALIACLEIDLVARGNPPGFLGENVIDGVNLSCIAT